ncbi:MAG: hypothetical protein AB7K63_09845 [Vicinamibacterales bacterium]
MTDQELQALFENEARVAAQEARVPAPGQVWWRAAMRSRAEAARAAERPLTWSQGLAAACAVGLAAAAAGAAWPRILTVVSMLGEGARWLVPAAAAIVMCAAIVPFALYLALSDD